MKQAKPLNCPICEEGQMEHKLLSTDKGETPMWICDECPAVLFEFWQNKDAENVHTYFTKGVEACQSNTQQK